MSRAQYSQLIAENREKYAYTSDALSVAQLFEFVKQHDNKFNPKSANQFFLNNNGTPKVFYHGAKKHGGFTAFRDWSYFTEQKRYVKRYAERGNKKSLYEVYLTADKVFDTRDEDAAKIFESIRQEYGLGELQDTDSRTGQTDTTSQSILVSIRSLATTLFCLTRAGIL